MVSELDAGVGRILAKLKAEGMREDTLIWFFSDNGGLNRAASPEGVQRVVDGLVSVFGRPLPVRFLEFVRENVDDGASDNAPLRGGKTGVYEGGIRVPSVISWPGRVAPGESDAFVTAQDVLPTLLEAVGLASRIPGDLDGDGRWDAIRDDEVRGREPDSMRAFRVEGLGGVALVRPPWKLVVQGPPLPFAGSEPELYNVYSDEGEKENLADEFPETVAELTAQLEAWPVGPSIHGSVFWTVVDPDTFGGPEDRVPWAEAAR